MSSVEKMTPFSEPLTSSARSVSWSAGGAAKARKRVATFALDGEVRFASAADRCAFAEELTRAVTSLVSKYHDEKVEGGRHHRVIIAVHPFAVHQPSVTPQPKES